MSGVSFIQKILYRNRMLCILKRDRTQFHDLNTRLVDYSHTHLVFEWHFFNKKTLLDEIMSVKVFFDAMTTRPRRPISVKVGEFQPTTSMVIR